MQKDYSLEDAARSADSISIQSIGVELFEGSLARLESHVFLFCRAGDAVAQMSGRNVSLEAGQLIFIPAKTPHVWSLPDIAKEVSFSAFSLTLRPAILKSLRPDIPELSGLSSFLKGIEKGAVLRVADRQRLESRIHSLRQSRGLMRVARLYAFLELAIHLEVLQVFDEEDDGSDVSLRDRARFEAARSYIEAHFASPLSRDAVAQHVGLEVGSFSRFFHRVSGSSFSDYLASVRLQKAAGMLTRERRTSISSIANACGYGNLSAFNRQFKNRLGLTPSAYRKAANSEILAP